jgi:hypothetical protein
MAEKLRKSKREENLIKIQSGKTAKEVQERIKNFIKYNPLYRNS